ncbi:PAS domain S-box protein [Devosia ginsengisoli]|uniref:Blue-light-activated histidine kinase n=1 Tax=Devosia ginsengisoli TaxID=400770 RepID=A0A5B8LSN6_9HYPH|nr:PAS domain S-box protein [Devosia ginsengisoli]QDZ10664.1 PAS domain S-box protein [Devosia ginsengisoli]
MKQAPASAKLFRSMLPLGAPGRQLEELLEALPAAIYTTDAAGHITYYNEAATALWGVRPELGNSEFCGSWKLFWPDGTPLPHNECPMALALTERRPNRGLEAVAERPDGTRVHFLPYPTPLFDRAGNLIGGVNMLMDITARHQADAAAQQLAAIVEASDDAILSKDLNGVITSWNRGAERLFGYLADEIIGLPVMVLIPADRQHEEPDILARIRRGERIEHFETIRRRKDGSLVEISLTVSPIKNPQGKVIGASKIARDITDRRRAEEQQQLLLEEMNHRIKNLFALASSVVTLSSRSADSVEGLVEAVRDRLNALSQAHAFILPRGPGDAPLNEQSTTLHTLIRMVLQPYNDQTDDGRERVSINGADAVIVGPSLTGLALLVHEFATNAAKYGAFSSPEGYVDINCEVVEEQFMLTWIERGGPPVTPAETAGFGSQIARATVERQLGGEMSRRWDTEGLTIRLSISRDSLCGQ